MKCHCGCLESPNVQFRKLVLHGADEMRRVIDADDAFLECNDVVGIVERRQLWPLHCSVIDLPGIGGHPIGLPLRLRESHPTVDDDENWNDPLIKIEMFRS